MRGYLFGVKMTIELLLLCLGLEVVILYPVNS